MSALNAYLDKLKTSAIAKGFFATLLGSGVSKLILVLSAFVLARILNKEDFGSFSFVRNTLNILLSVCAMNYVELLTKFTAEQKYDERALPRIILLFVVSVFICVCVSATMLLIPDGTLSSVSGQVSLNVYFRLTALVLPLFILQPLTEAVFRGLKMFRLIAFLQTGSSLFFVLFVLCGVSLGGKNGAIIGLMLYYVLYSIASTVVFLKKTDFSRFRLLSYSRISAESKVILTMILPVFVLSFIEAPVNWWSQVLMTKYDSMSSIGSMTAILQIRNLLLLIPGYLFSTLIPFQASMNVEGAQNKYFRYLQRAFIVCLVSGLVLAILISAAGPVLLGLYGSSYISDAPAFRVAMVSFPLMLCSGLLRGSMIVKEHQHVMLITSVVSSFAQLAVMYILLPKGINPVDVYFWAQFVFYLLLFSSFISCSLYDYKKSL